MWNVKPEYLCRKHLLGEHVEIHMLVGAINKNRSLKGFIDKQLVSLTGIETRHDELVIEMGNRGYKHKSPLPKFAVSVLSPPRNNAALEKRDMNDLTSRCPECSSRIDSAFFSHHAAI